MTKEEAILELKAEDHRVEAEQPFEVRRLEPADAWGVARCFFAVYGEHYPFDTYYIPAKLIEENQRRNVFSVVARTDRGDIVGYAALYRSSAHYPGLYELGQALVLPEYRFTFAALCMQDYLLDTLAQSEGIDAIFGEAVCNHLITQKMMTMADFRETGLELGLMPAEAYRDLEYPNDRVSTVLGFKTVHDKAQVVYIPAEYAQALEYILSDLDISRSQTASTLRAATGAATDLVPQFIDHAQVARCNLHRIGEDLPEVLTSFEGQAQSRGARVTQVFINLGEPCSGWAVAWLRQRGYFFGGFLPRWFDTDGLLMERLDLLPQFESIKLASARSRRILDFISEDIERNPACRYLLTTNRERG